MMFLLCRTEPDAKKHDRAVVFAAVDGFIRVLDRLALLKTMTGRSEFSEVFFTDVKVPESQIVLGRGKWHGTSPT